jgi:hypothetical protein
MVSVTWSVWRPAQFGPRIEPISISDTAVIVTDSWCLRGRGGSPVLSQAQISNFSGTTSGPHALLREGAKLVEIAADIFEDSGVRLPRSGEKAVLVATSAQR